MSKPMNFERKDLFRFPWSTTDNPGAWIEVTDVCNLSCPGCFRKNNLTGHRPLEEIKREVVQCRDQLNCSRICISGGEPLLYPDIIETVRYISSLKMKPIILTNGECLTQDLLLQLKKAGLFQFYFHADSGQDRPGWTGKTEEEMNELRQQLTDMVYHAGKIWCGFNLTVRRSNFGQINNIVKWFRSNIHKVNHLSLITYRGIPDDPSCDMLVDGQKIDQVRIDANIRSEHEITISTIDLHDELARHFDDIYPTAYLNGIPMEDTFKYLVIVNIGSKNRIYGTAGSKTIELYQLLYHVFMGRYDATIPDPGRAIFFMALFDRRLRSALKKYLFAVFRNPLRLFEGIHIQALILQQPFEVIDGKPNLCDGCINLMPYQGKLINSCRLDEYRLLGGPITFIKHNKNCMPDERIRNKDS
jgi:organic radical activating enzyme